jgi:hypothetical protein
MTEQTSCTVGTSLSKPAISNQVDAREVNEIVETIKQQIRCRQNGPAYTRKRVLAFHWENSGKENCEAFCEAMHGKLGFETTVVALHTKHDYVKLVSFSLTLGEDELLVVYYSGEGKMNNDNFILHGQANCSADFITADHTIDFDIIKEYLSLALAKPHLLYILDCCYAGCTERGEDRVIEYLSASSTESVLKDNGIFTEKLIEVIENMKDDTTFSVENLVEQLRKEHEAVHYINATGINSIRFTKGNIANATPAKFAEQFRFVVEVGFQKNFTEEEILLLGETLNRVADPEGLKLQCKAAFNSTSTHIIFQASLVAFNILSYCFAGRIVQSSVLKDPKWIVFGNNALQ